MRRPVLMGPARCHKATQSDCVNTRTACPVYIVRRHAMLCHPTIDRYPAYRYTYPTVHYTWTDSDARRAYRFSIKLRVENYRLQGDSSQAKIEDALQVVFLHKLSIKLLFATLLFFQTQSKIFIWNKTPRKIIHTYVFFCVLCKNQMKYDINIMDIFIISARCLPRIVEPILLFLSFSE